MRLVNKCTSARHIIIIPPQKKRKKQRSPQMFYTVALTWDVGQWERSVIVMWKGPLKDKFCSNVNLLYSFGIGKDK
jgi:hypothetical protein